MLIMFSCIRRFQRDAIRIEWRQLMQSDMRNRLKTKTISLLYLQTSKKFLIRIFVVFFDLTEPASKKANPVCITARKNITN